MSEKKKRRNMQIYSEYQGLLKSMKYHEAYTALAQKWDLSENTIRCIVTDKNYGTNRKLPKS